ncbi:putative flippase GtrA [Rhodovulum iodosum]|uniref:Flippase GtrA n=1 Tax=Rhodovulum iodosum TaxID=68291 RepID=A0ABV3XNH5_9RHOB|nr:GtrA family protein [Rhodovulum robiginosum]RSK35894.1 GtrA family protein [Rhodovulum robiginosum]
MSRTDLILRYAGFAVLATLANLAAQRGVLALWEGALALPLAIGTGTLAGLVLKYLLDKRWIFADRSRGAAMHARKFTLYTLMGVATTLIFWGTETAFWLIWKTDPMRELGAVLGLAVGYVVKYQLDRRYVFAPATPSAPA